MLYSIVALSLFATVNAVPAATKISSASKIAPVSRNLAKGLPKRAVQPRQVSAKSSVASDPGTQALDKMYGKVYDNVLFRQETGWDPVGLARGQPEAVLKKYRDAELLHGRMGMLAVAGILAAEKFHPVFPDASGTAHEQLARVNELVPAFKWFALGHIIINEALRTPKFDIENRGDRLWEGEEPGNYGWDPLNLMPKTEDAKAVRSNQEVNNGRLAMVAALGMLAEEQLTGKPIADKIIPNM